MKQQVTISLTRTMASLDKFRQIFTEKLKQLALSEDDISQFELCVYEVLINVIEHEQFSNEEDQIIKVKFTLNNTSAEVTLTYRGTSFDLTQSPLPDIESHFSTGNKRGLGIYIIHTLMDDLSYSHNEGINTLSMIKSIQCNNDIEDTSRQ